MWRNLQVFWAEKKAQNPVMSGCRGFFDPDLEVSHLFRGLSLISLLLAVPLFLSAFQEDLQGSSQKDP